MPKKTLKIGIVVDQLLPGGVQIAAIEQVRNLRRLGYNAKLVILMRKKYSFRFDYLVKDVPYQYLSDSYPLLFRDTFKFPIFAFLSTLHLLSPFLAPRVINEHAYDLLVSHGTTTCLTTLALWRQRRIPYLAVIHDPMVFILKKVYARTLLRFTFPVLIPVASFLEKTFVRAALATIIDSNVHQEFIRENYQIEPVILPLGCQVARKIPHKRGNLILAISRWQKEKNPLLLLQILKSIPKARLVIAGVWTNKNDLDQFQKATRKLKVNQRLKIISQFEKKDLAGLFRQARVWVHPHFENFGLGALEAAAFGCPIIIPAGSGVTDLFLHGRDGFFPKTATVKEYRKYLSRLLADERLAFRLGKNAWLRTKENYSWPVNAQKLAKIIQDRLLPGKLPNLTVIELGHSPGVSLAGGDKLMEPMATRSADRFQFTVITSQIGADHWQKAALAKELTVLPPNRFDRKPTPVAVFLTYCLRMSQAYRSLRKQTKLDIIYSSNNILPDVLPAYLTKKKRPESRWVARIHHLIPPPYQREGRFIVNLVSYLMQAIALRMVKNSADISIALNDSLEKTLIRQGFPEKRLTVLGGGIEFDRIANFQPSKKAPKFEAVYLGRLHIAKGVFDTIPIWQKVIQKFPRAKLAIIGDGPVEIKDKLKAEILKNNLAKNMTVFGFLSLPQVLAILKTASVFLFLDHEAGWGLAVAEAMACKLPVIGYDLGVLGDAFKAGYLTVPCFDQKVFAQKIISLLDNPEARQKLSGEAFRQAQKLSWEKTTARFLEILEPLLKPKE